MGRFSLVGAALLLLAGSASAQQVYKITDHYECRTKTTTIERVEVVPYPRLDRSSRLEASPLLVWLGLDSLVYGRPAAPSIMLGATDWYCGRCFTDDMGRRWCLLKGCPLPEKLPFMRGWLLECDNKIVYFVHETGNIYRREANVPVP